MAKTKELSELSVKELEAKIKEYKEESVNLLLQKATGQLENSARIRTVRREIARLQTLLTAKA